MDEPMRTAVLIGALVAAELASGSIAAQTTGIVRGRVVDSVTGRPLSSAQISIGSRAALSDSAGTFVVSGVDTGRQELRATRLGYGDVRRRVAVSVPDAVSILVTMIPVPTELQAVRVGGRSVPARFADAYRRAASGRGVFFMREQLDSINARDYQSILNQVPTVRANDRGVTFARCQNSGAIRPELQSKVQVWVDGRRTAAADSPENLMDVLRTIPPVSIQIIEIYASQSAIPAVFTGDACAVIAIWTRAS
jgi:hypothetical protein